VKTILVTGANGFLGKHLVRDLISSSCKVLATDIQGKFTPSFSSANLSYFSCNLVETNDIVRELIAEVDCVIHLASIVGSDVPKSSPSDVFKINVSLPIDIAILCAQNSKKFIFASSSDVYGKNGVGNLKETADRTFGSPLDQSLNYGIGKAIVENYLFGISNVLKLDFTIVRIFNMYGFGQNHKYLISKAINHAFHDLPLQIYGSGNQRNSYTYVADVSLCLSEIPAMPIHGVMNLGSPESHSIKEVCSILQEHFPNLTTDKLSHESFKTDASFVCTPNLDKFRKYFPNFQFTAFRDGLGQTIKLERDNRQKV